MELKGFRPYLYSTGITDFWSPPFDTINSEQERDLKRHMHNITHITLPGDRSMQEVRSTFEKWSKEGVLRRIDSDALVILSQKFTHSGKVLARTGIVGIVKINPDDGSIKPHEKTFEGPRKNRSTLMKGLGLVPEPIFIIVQESILPQLLAKAITRSEEYAEFEEPAGVSNKVYLLRDSDMLRAIELELRSKTGIVADGHHRLAAASEIAKELGKGWDYTMAYIASGDDPGLLIAGIHRIVQSNEDIKAFFRRLEGYFTPVKIEKWSGSGEFAIMTNDGIFSLLPKNSLPDFYVRMRRSDPGKFVAEFIMQQLAGLKGDKMETGVVYSHDIDYISTTITEGKAKFAILMPDWDKKTFMNVVSRGNTISQKSTYFYPKPPSGIALYEP